MTRPVQFLRWKPFGLLLLIGVFAHGCSGEGGTPMAQSARSLEVVPYLASLSPGGSETFVALADGAAVSGVQWYAAAGSITSAGLFTAPSEAGSYQIQARYAGATGSATAIVSVPGTPASFYAAASSSCANMPLRTTGTIYYFCDCQTGAQAGCLAGNDANAGTNASAPKQTLRAITDTFNAMNAGDTVALCKGGAWSTNTTYLPPTLGLGTGWTFLNLRCTAGSNLTDPANTGTCDLRDYTPSWGGTAKPILRQTAQHDLMQVTRGAQHGIRILNLDFEGGGTGPGAGGGPGGGALPGSVGQKALLISDNATDVLVCNNTFNRWLVAVHADAQNGPLMRRLTFKGNVFTLNMRTGLLGGSSDFAVDANLFNSNGGDSIYHHHYYGQGRNATNTSVTNNQFLASLSPCNMGGVLVAHDQLDYFNIENNYFDLGTGQSCWAITIGSGDYLYNEYFRHTTIRRNRIRFGGWTAIALSNAPYGVIENNVIQYNGSISNPPLIEMPNRAARTPAPNGIADDATTNGVVRNNNIYLSSSAGTPRAINVPGTGLPAGEGTGHVIANNSVYFSSGGTCFTTSMAAGAYAFVGNNACYGGTWGTTYDATTHIMADPRFTSPPTDFTPSAGSPLIGAGTSAYRPTTDFTLKTRPNPPSIGAFEP